MASTGVSSTGEGKMVVDSESTINSEIDMVRDYFGYPEGHPDFEQLKTVLSREISRQENIHRKDLFLQIMSTSQNNKFITMHGDPLPPQESGPGKHPYFFQIPPDSNIIIVKPTPDGTVVFGSDDEDLHTYRWFKQLNALKSGYSSGARDTGASPPQASIEGKQDGENYDEESSSDDESVPKDVASLDEDEYTNIAERVSELHRRINLKAENIKKKAEEKIQKKKQGYTKEDADELLSTYYPGKSPLLDGFGNEILHNFQVFFPGDFVYNQEQSFEEGDKNFNTFLLGQVYSGTPGKISSAYDQTFNEIPIGFDLTHMDGLPSGPVLTLDKQGPKMVNHTMPNYIWPLYNRLNAQQRGKHIMTTQQLVMMAATQEKGFQVIFFNSCSPYRDSRKMSMGDKFTDSNIGNLILRNLIFKHGREQFLTLRRNLPALEELPAIIPQYDEHRGITVAFSDDRQEFHKSLGNFLLKIHQGPELFTPTHFRVFYELCNTSDPRGNLMRCFYKKYTNFYNETQRRDGTTWNSKPSRIAGLLTWNDEIDLLEKAAMGYDITTLNQIRESKRLKHGGRKKRRKKRTRRKRKKNKKTRKKRGKGSKEIEMTEIKPKSVSKDPEKENQKAIERLRISQAKTREIQRLRALQYEEEEKPLGKYGESKGNTPKRKNKKKENTGITVTGENVDNLYYSFPGGEPPLRGGKKKKNKTRKKNKNKLVWPPKIGTIVKRKNDPKVSLKVIRLVENDKDSNLWEVGLRQKNKKHLLLRNKDFFLKEYLFIKIDKSKRL